MAPVLPWSRLWVLGCAQNCAAALPAVLANIERLRGLFTASELLILENDSNDATRDLIAAHGGRYPGVHALGFAGLNGQIPVKTLRLAHLRNGAMAWAQQRGAFAPGHLLVVLDLDEVNAAPWDLAAMGRVLGWFAAQPQAAAVFANQLGPYYDLWALRHPSLCPDDLWEQLMRAHLAEPGLGDELLFEQLVLPKQLSFPLKQPPFEVESAFGGMGFYKGEWLLRQRFAYAGERTLLLVQKGQPRLVRWQVAEHVNFHLGLRAAGASLWIHPALVNWCTQDLPGGLRMNPHSWRHMSF